jgi:hypothetical protein
LKGASAFRLRRLASRSGMSFVQRFRMPDCWRDPQGCMQSGDVSDGAAPAPRERNGGSKIEGRGFRSNEVPNQVERCDEPVT